MGISGIQPIVPFYTFAKQMQPDAKLGNKIGVASEHTYTKEDALLNQYNRQFDIHATVDDIASGRFDVNNIRLPSYKSEDIEAYRQKLESNGLGGDIDWQGVNFDFSTVNVGLDTVDQVSGKADYIASRYAVLKDRINSNYSGDKRNEQMAKLDELFSGAKALLADSYTNVVGGFLGQNGVDGEADNLRESILQGIDSRADEYSAYILNHRDYVKIDSDSEKWLLQDDGYMAAQLRDSMTDTAMADKVSVKQSPPAYSLHDLDVAGMYVKQTSAQYASLDNTGFIRNEESIGLEMAVQSMKTDYLTKNSGIGSSAAALINRTFDGYMKNYLDKVDAQLKKNADHSIISGSKQLFAPLDMSAVYGVYQYTMSQYNSSGDMMKALVDGAQYAKKQYDQKVDSEAYGTMARYQSDILYNWDNFFQSTGKKSYDINISELQKYSITLNHFTEGVKSGNVQSIDLMLGLGGDISANRVTYSNFSQYAQGFNWETYA